MEERLTHTVTTPKNNHVVVLKDWINGREKQRIDGALIGGFNTEGQGENVRPVMSETMLASKENATIIAIVVSICKSSGCCSICWNT